MPAQAALGHFGCKCNIKTHLCTELYVFVTPYATLTGDTDVAEGDHAMLKAAAAHVGAVADSEDEWQHLGRVLGFIVLFSEVALLVFLVSCRRGGAAESGRGATAFSQPQPQPVLAPTVSGYASVRAAHVRDVAARLGGLVAHAVNTGGGAPRSSPAGASMPREAAAASGRPGPWVWLCCTHRRQ